MCVLTCGVRAATSGESTMTHLSAFSRRGFLAAGAGIAAASVVGCSSSTATGTGSGAAPGKASMWGMSGQPNEKILTDCVTAFNKMGKGTVDVTFFQNDAYKPVSYTHLRAHETGR